MLTNFIFNIKFNKQPFNAINYYRLRQIDLNEKSEYSEILAIDFGVSASSFQVMNIFPNPAESEVVVEFSISQKLQNITLSIYNLIGEEILEKKIDSPEEGINRQSIDISLLAPGMYYLHLKVDQEEKVFRIIK